MTAGREDLGGPVEQTETVQGGGGDDHGPAVGDLFEAGTDVAPEAGKGQVGAHPGQLGAPAHRTGRDPRPRPQVRQPGSDQGVTGVGPADDSVQSEALGRPGRQVLGRVDGEVGAPLQNRGLHLLDEHPLATQLPDRDLPALVAGGRDHHQLDLQPGLGGAQGAGHLVGLPPGQLAAPGGDPQRLSWSWLPGQRRAVRCRARTTAEAPAPAARRSAFRPRL